MTTIERKTYDVKEAAKILGISQPRMYILAHSDQFPAIFIGRRIIIPKERFHEWMDTATGKDQDAALGQ